MHSALHEIHRHFYAIAQLMSLGSNKAKDFCNLSADVCDEVWRYWRMTVTARNSGQRFKQKTQVFLKC